MQRLRTSLREPRVISTGHGPNGVLQEPQFLVSACQGGRFERREDKGTHDDVGVAIDVLGKTVQDDVSPKEKGGGVEGRQKGVVDKEEGVGRMAMYDLGQAGDIDEAEGWVCR
jgi:hypothetical protein